MRASFLSAKTGGPRLAIAFRVKKIALLLLLVVAGLAALAIAMPKRRTLILRWAKAKVEVAHGCSVFTRGIFDDEDRFEATIGKTIEIQRDGPITMYDTPIGSVWYPVGAWTLPALVEASQADQYHLRSTIKPGDVVLDVGASVGTETRSALSAGASLVVAIEPDPVSLKCLRRNLSAEIREKRVVVVPKGAWDKEDTLTLHLDSANGGSSSFLWSLNDQSIQAPVTTIDQIVADLKVPKVNMIKMHVEGAEKQALLGATKTIQRYHPRLAVTLEHRLDDVDVLPAVARHIWPGYHVELTPCTKTFNRIHPAVALMMP